MIREIGGRLGPASSRTFRDDTGHTVRVSTQGMVPTNGCIGDGQSATQPAPNITVEDLGYGHSVTVTGSRAIKPHPDAMSLGQHPDGVLSPAGEQAVIDEAMRAAGAERREAVQVLMRKASQKWTYRIMGAQGYETGFWDGDKWEGEQAFWPTWEKACERANWLNEQERLQDTKARCTT